MSSRYRSFCAAAALLLLATLAFAQRELKVCADGDNPPYSSRDLTGLDNKIAALLARDLKVKITYYWSRMGRGYIRDVLNARDCDLLIEVPTEFPLVLTTPPFYRSSYVFVTRRDRNLNIRSLDDPRLHELKIGVQIVAENYSPPGQALGRRGIFANIVAFKNTGKEAAEIIDAVANGKVDVAIAWGPLAGYFARQQHVALEIAPVSPAMDPPGIPFQYSMSMGVRKSDTQLRDELAAFLVRRKKEIDGILRTYGVPRIDTPATETASN
jgi:mxaJ protein